MNNPRIQKVNYHPDVRLSSTQSSRKVQARLRILQSKLDFKNKVIWDLGCNGGFFSFSLAAQAKKIIAVDGDLELIEHNKMIQRELGISNIEFIHAPITTDLIDGLERADITLFLAVFHHMMTVSSVYDWNQGVTTDSASQLMDCINRCSNTLVFEIGYPNEGCDWCEKLPDYGHDWDDYVINNIFRGCYQSVEAVMPAIRLNWCKKRIGSQLSVPYKEDSLFIRRIKRVLGFDARDLRKIYFGYK